jgi:hypothetical protein
MHPRHNTYQADQVIDAVHADPDSRALQTTSALQRLSRPGKDRHLVPRVYSWGFVAASRRLVPLGPQHRLELSTGVDGADQTTPFTAPVPPSPATDDSCSRPGPAAPPASGGARGRRRGGGRTSASGTPAPPGGPPAQRVVPGASGGPPDPPPRSGFGIRPLFFAPAEPVTLELELYIPNSIENDQ